MPPSGEADMRMRALSRWVAPLCAAVLLAACALTKFETPKLTVIGVQLISADLWTQHLKVRIRVDNPNERALPVSAIEFTLEVEGQPFASGASASSFVVPAMGEAEFDTNVSANLAGTLLGLLLRGGDATQSVAYHLSGKLSLSQGLLRSIPFEQRGAFSLQ
jgi:LEA14-like dessication related protein